MRPLIYNFITLVLAVAGVVQATVINQLDGENHFFVKTNLTRQILILV